MSYMKKLRRLLSTYRLQVDDKGRLKLPREVADALGEKCQVLVISPQWQTVRIYPLGGSVSRRIVLGKKQAKRAKSETTWTGRQIALLGLSETDPVSYESLGRADVMEVVQGRLLVAPHSWNEKSIVGLENEDVLLRWDKDHFTLQRGE
jgi:DNA-binding transcriptional regulator/RsmH inhibitor MraZ